MTRLLVEFFEDDQWLGGSIYIDNLLAALSDLGSDDRPTVSIKFLSSPQTSLARRLTAHAAVETLSPLARSSFAARVRRLQRALVRRWPFLAILVPRTKDIVYFPAFDAKQQWRKNLFWIPDFQPFHFPHLFEKLELAIRRSAVKSIADFDGILLLSSKAALSDFTNFFPHAVVRPRVWSFCSSINAPEKRCSETLQHYRLPEKFLYVANHFWKHKDHETAFKALKILKDRGIDVTVVCTGLRSDRRDPDYYASLARMLDIYGLTDKVRILGVVPRDDQINLFRVAVAVVQPSRFEGWSTVIEDAKALGRPVIASDIAVHVEQIGGMDDCRLFKVSDEGDLAEKIAELWPQLEAGPVLSSERMAAERRDAFRAESAKCFAAIVEEAALFSPR